MIFSQEIKNEIANLKLSKNVGLIKIELLGFAISNSTTINKSSIRFLNENIDIISRYKYILRKLTKLDIIESEMDSDDDKKELFEIYIDDVKNKEDICNLLEIKDNKDINVDSIKNINNDEKISFLRGAFLGSGYISNPQKEYHLQMIIDNENTATFIKNTLKSLDINAHIIPKNNQYIIYLKNSEMISYFIGLIGASIGVIHFEEERVLKEMNNNLNRVINCETANLSKSIETSKKQIEYINKIKEDGKYDLLNDKLKTVCEFRINNPELSLMELANLIGISKSGLNNRLNKIKQIAQGE